VNDTTKDLLVIKVGAPPEITRENVQQHLDAVIKGRAVEFSDEVLLEIVDLARVRKIYKLNSNEGPGKKNKGRSLEGTNGVDGLRKDEHAMKALEVAILGMIALRGAS